MQTKDRLSAVYVLEFFLNYINKPLLPVVHSSMKIESDKNCLKEHT